MAPVSLSLLGLEGTVELLLLREEFTRMEFIWSSSQHCFFFTVGEPLLIRAASELDPSNT